MYGLVNSGFEEMVRREHGDAMWNAVREKAGIDATYFAAHEGYDDSVTYALVGAASELLKLPVEELLERFGRYWILETAAVRYAGLMASTGVTLRDFLTHLPALHTRVALSFPHLEPPTFTCEDVRDTSLTVCYTSRRPGLRPFVVGLLHGLGERFQTPVTVRVEPTPDHPIAARFHVAWHAPA